ncbi:SRP72 domain-containing protein, partial [Favolaschia claudopus]
MPTPAPKSKSKSTGSSGVSKSTHISKPKTRVPLAVPEQTKRLLKTLVAQIDGGHNLNAIKTCDKILRLAPSDPDALQTKLFLLLSTDQPAAAITLIESLNEEGANAFERAYALYCLNKRAEARDALPQSSAEVDERGARHLEAQLDYREGAYQAAFDIYNDLLDSAPTAEEQADILTNIQAASSHLDFINTTFLHSLDALPTHLQTQLEDAPPPALPSSAPVVQVAAEPVRAAPPKEKKVRLPKGVVLGVTPPPDPERWLKKSERSNLGQKR